VGYSKDPIVSLTFIRTLALGLGHFALADRRASKWPGPFL